MAIVLSFAPESSGTLGLVTLAQYRTQTGDQTTADAAVIVALDDARRLVEEYLGRWLVSKGRTETLYIERYRVYPHATPISDAPGLTVDGDAIYGLTYNPYDLVYNYTPEYIPALGYPKPTATVTYTGGFTSDTLPVHLRRAIINATHEQVQSLSSSVVSGVASVRLGDASVTYATASSGSTVALSAATTDSIAAYRRRFV